MQPTPHVLAAIGLALLVTPSARPDLAIELEFDADASAQPRLDRDGAGLRAIMEAAAEYWEGCLPGLDRTVRIRYFWYDYDRGGAAGRIFDAGGFLDVVDGSGDGDEYAKHNCGGWLSSHDSIIRFDIRTAGNVAIPWWIDPTPGDDTEFDMQQRLYRELSSDEKAAWYTGDVPLFLEATYGGSALPGAAAEGMIDLYTVALHEIGHALGVPACGSGLDPWQFAPDPALVDGRAIGIAWDLEHLVAESVLGEGITNGERRLPSATDVLAVAASNGIEDADALRLPRKSVDPAGALDDEDRFAWQDDDAWYDDEPSAPTGAFVRSTQLSVMELLGNASARDLVVDEHATVAIGEHDLTISRDARVDSDDAAISIGIGGELQAERVLVRSGSILCWGGNVVAGQVRLNWDAGITEAPGTKDAFLMGSGTIVAFERLVNGGEIRTSNGDLLLLGGTLDLDGDAPYGPDVAEVGTLHATGGSLFVYAPVADPLNQWIEIAGHESVRFAEVVQFEAGALVTMRQESHLETLAELAFGDGSLVRAEGGSSGSWIQAWVDGAVRYGGGSAVNPGEYALITMTGATTLDGGRYTGVGAVRQVGDLVVESYSAVDGAKFIWDGDDPWGAPTSPSITEIVAGGTLHIGAGTSISVGSGDGFDGAVIVHAGGVLRIDHAWRLEGSIVLAGGTVSGGTIRNLGVISGYGTIEAAVENAGAIECTGSGIHFESGVTDLGGILDCP